MKLSGSWILGVHSICAQTQDVFQSYTKYDDWEVLLSNNQYCLVKGIGSVHLKLQDSTIKILSSIRHV